MNLLERSSQFHLVMRVDKNLMEIFEESYDIQMR